MSSSALREMPPISQNFIASFAYDSLRFHLFESMITDMKDSYGTSPTGVHATSRNRFFGKRIMTVELVLFLGLWLFYGMLINEKTINDYGQLVTESIVDKQSFALEKNTAWPVGGDVFGYGGHTYSNKNPGQAIISSIVYAHLRLFGISYAGDRTFASALVIFFSTSLFTAFGAVVLYWLARDLDGRRTVIWPLASALVWSLCTTQTAFSGVAWHDPLAAPMLVTAVYLLHKVRNSLLSPEMARNFSILGGFLLGMTFTTSPAFVFMIVLFGIYFFTFWRWELLVPFLIGGLLGAAPTPIYNTLLFGNPFLFATVAAFNQSVYPSDNYFYFNWSNFTGKIFVYYNLINWYSPVLWCGLVGLLFLPAKFRREQLFVFGAIAVLAFYMFNIDGLGVCGYGPRYLIPILPFCALGIVGLGQFPTKILKGIVGAAVFWVAMISLKINVVGAIGGALFCNYSTSGYPGYLSKLSTGPLPYFPLFGMLLPFFVLWFVWAIYSQTTSQHAPARERVLLKES